MSTALAERFLKAWVRHRDAAGGSLQFDTTALSGLQLESIRASPGRISAVLPVTPEVANVYGTLHGGCIATLADTLTTAALTTVSAKAGVSINLSVNFLSKASLGGSVLIEAEVVRAGARIATIEVRLRDAASGELVAQGTHVKYIAAGEPPMARLLDGQQQAAAGTQAAAGRGSNVVALDRRAVALPNEHLQPQLSPISRL